MIVYNAFLLTHLIVYNAFLLSWNFVYESSVSYHGYDFIPILKINPIVGFGEAWHAAIHGVTKSQTRMSD